MVVADGFVAIWRQDTYNNHDDVDPLVSLKNSQLLCSKSLRTCNELVSNEWGLTVSVTICPRVAILSIKSL